MVGSASGEAIEAQLEILQALMPEVRAFLADNFPPAWPELRELARPLFDEPLDPLAVLPLASCAAVGGDPREAVPAAAAWRLLMLAVGLLDDLQDRDHEGGLWARVGPARAFNYSAALYSVCYELLGCAPWAPERKLAVSRRFSAGALALAEGQDRDLRGAADTLAAYWQTIEGKNGAGFAMACGLGALCGPGEAAAVAACERFGHHLGITLQILNDYVGLWSTQGPGDLLAGRRTLPVLYGLRAAHPARAELAALLADDPGAHVRRIRELLDTVGARDFVLWTALQERERAADALALCPGELGVNALMAYADTLFLHLDALRDGQL